MAMEGGEKEALQMGDLLAFLIDKKVHILPIFLTEPGAQNEKKNTERWMRDTILESNPEPQTLGTRNLGDHALNSSFEISSLNDKL